MDLAMPGLDGWMAISLLRARCPSTPVVILTNSSGAEVEQQALHAGAAAFLSKPCAPELFTRTISRVIGRA
jgi:CheY-like chemotaxis protein